MDSIKQAKGIENSILMLILQKMPFVREVKMDSDLFRDLGFDSILMLDLILTLEEHYSYTFAENDLELDKINTPRKIIDLITQKSNKPVFK